MKGKSVRFLACMCAILAVLAGSVVLSGSAAPVAGDSITTVGVDPAAKLVDKAEQFTLDVLVTPAGAIAGAQCDINFDSSLLTVDSVAEGNLLTQGGATSYFNPGTVDNTAGTIRGIAGAITTPGATVSGQGVFATITFTAGATDGATDAVLSSVIVADINGARADISVTNGGVIVGSPVSGDGDGGGDSDGDAAATGDGAGADTEGATGDGEAAQTGTFSSTGFAWYMVVVIVLAIAAVTALILVIVKRRRRY